MRSIIVALILSATLALAASEKVAIIPVAKFPTVVYLGGKQICNASVADCVKAGYRLLSAKPSTPSGKIISSEIIIQDPASAEKCTYSITYTDAPVVSPVILEATTNVLASEMYFTCGVTSGVWKGTVVWAKAAKTNVVAGKE